MAAEAACLHACSRQQAAASPEEWRLSPFFTVSAVVGGPTGAADSMAPPPLGWYVNTSPMLLSMLLSS